MKHGFAHRFVAIGAVGLVLSLGACNDDDDPTGPPSAADTYLLASIEQQGYAECTIGTTGCTLNETGSEVIVVESGVLALETNTTFTLVVSGTTDGVDDVLGSLAGNWVQTQTGVTLNVTGVGVPLTGTFSSSAQDELVFVVPGSAFNSTTGTVTVTFDRQ
jgi:hypothetical protein